MPKPLPIVTHSDSYCLCEHMRKDHSYLWTDKKRKPLSHCYICKCKVFDDPLRHPISGRYHA